MSNFAAYFKKYAVYMNNKRREGGFYAAKVRLFLNEYNGISLEEFCKAENVSYSKMCNCLGGSSYRKENTTSNPLSDKNATSVTNQPELPEMELKPLVIDMPTDDGNESITTKEPVTVKSHGVASGYLSDVRLRTASRTEIVIGKCPVNVLVILIKEMEAMPC